MRMTNTELVDNPRPRPGREQFKRSDVVVEWERNRGQPNYFLVFITAGLLMWLTVAYLLFFSHTPHSAREDQSRGGNSAIPSIGGSR